MFCVFIEKSLAGTTTNVIHLFKFLFYSNAAMFGVNSVSHRIWQSRGWRNAIQVTSQQRPWYFLRLLHPGDHLYNIWRSVYEERSPDWDVK